MRSWLLILALSLWPVLAGAQGAPPGPVTTYPKAVWGCAPTSAGINPTTCPNNASGAITSTGVFQKVFPAPANGLRTGCTIQNNGSATMWVFPGPTSLAAKATSVQLGPPANGQPGGVFYCNLPNSGTIQDEIAITGTSADAFYADSQ